MSDNIEFEYKGQKYRFVSVDYPKWVFAKKLDAAGNTGRGRPSKLPYDEVGKFLPDVRPAVETPVTEPVNSFPNDEAPVVVVNTPPVTDLVISPEGFVVLD